MFPWSVHLWSHLNWGMVMCPVSACHLQALVPSSLGQTGTWLCRSLANVETVTVWPGKKGRRRKEINKGIKGADYKRFPKWNAWIATNPSVWCCEKSHVTATPCRVWCKQWQSRSKDRIKRGRRGTSTRGKTGGRRTQKLWDSKEETIQSQMEACTYVWGYKG